MIKNNQIIFRPNYLYEVRGLKKSIYFSSRREARICKKIQNIKGTKIYQHRIQYTDTVVR